MKQLVLLIGLITLSGWLTLQALTPTHPDHPLRDREDLVQPDRNRIEYPLNEVQYFWSDSTWVITRRQDYSFSETNPTMSVLHSSYYQDELISQFRAEYYENTEALVDYIAYLDGPAWELSFLEIHVYNTQNQLTQIQFYQDPVDPDTPGVMSGRCEYEYDNQGNNTAIYYYAMYEYGFEYVSDRTLYYYDAQGQKIREDHAWCNDDFYLEYSSTLLYSYNPDGSLQEILSFPTGQTVASPGWSKTQYVYDASGYLIRRDGFQIPYPEGTQYEAVSVTNFLNDPWGRCLDEISQNYYNDVWYNTQRFVREYRPSANNDPSSPPVIALQCHPNPFETRLDITLDVRGPGPCEVDIYNLRGQRVRRLFSGSLRRGTEHLIWDGTGDCGERVTNGVYLIRVSTPSGNSSRKVILLK